MLHNCTTGEVIQQYPAACWLQVACAVFRADCIVVCSAVRRWQSPVPVASTRTTATCSGELQLGGYIIRNIPYGQSSAKLPVTKLLSHSVTQSLGHLVTRSLCRHPVVHCIIFSTYYNIRIYRSASQTIIVKRARKVSYNLQAAMLLWGR